MTTRHFLWNLITRRHTEGTNCQVIGSIVQKTQVACHAALLRWPLLLPEKADEPWEKREKKMSCVVVISVRSRTPDRGKYNGLLCRCLVVVLLLAHVVTEAHMCHVVAHTGGETNDRWTLAYFKFPHLQRETLATGFWKRRKRKSTPLGVHSAVQPPRVRYAVLVVCNDEKKWNEKLKPRITGSTSLLLHGGGGAEGRMV